MEVLHLVWAERDNLKAENPKRTDDDCARMAYAGMIGSLSAQLDMLYKGHITIEESRKFMLAKGVKL
jgi:hypothetical protein